MTLDWNNYSSDSDTENVSLLLSARSQSLILAVMQSLEFRSSWLEVDDATWDDIEASVAEAYEEIMEVVVPETDTGPVGSIVFWIGYTATIPAKWLKCVGQLLDGVDYPELYDVMPHDIYHGGGTEFSLPNLGEEFLRGGGTDEHVGDTGGENFVTLTVAQLPAHNHSVATRINALGNAATAATGNTANSSITTGNAGSGEGHNNLPPYMRGFWIIKAVP